MFEVFKISRNLKNNGYFKSIKNFENSQNLKILKNPTNRPNLLEFEKFRKYATFVSSASESRVFTVTDFEIH